MLAERAKALTTAHARTPERFVRKHPTPSAPRTEAWINKPTETPDTVNQHQPTNSTNS